MRVLVACEESQRVCIAFRNKGHDAFSCDIKPCSGGFPEWHLQCDVLSLLNDSWDLIIAHPPCTYLSKAGARFMYPQAGIVDPVRYEKALIAREFFMKIYSANCSKICIENPTPLRIVNLPRESQVIQPFEFGHPFSKRTLLWLKGLPKLKPTNILDDYVPFMPSNTSAFSKGKGGSLGFVNHSQAARSKTFSGIAAAMADQWNF